MGQKDSVWPPGTWDWPDLGDGERKSLRESGDDDGIKMILMVEMLEVMTQ